MEEIGSKSSFKCTFCKKTFSRIFNLKRHVKNVHAPAYSIFKEVFKEGESFKDSFCLRLSQLRLPQSEREAKSNFVHSTLKEGEIFKEFIDFSEFLIWKEQQERETSSMYVKQRGNAIKKNGDEVLRYYCHRSGVYKPRGKGLKRLKSQGSAKIGASCPARMIVNITSGSVIVHFFKKHENHELGVEHLRLPQSEREAVAAMEVCADSLESAINAEKGGASRIELCADLGGGGTTPSIGLLQTVKELLQIPVFVMIRPRLGDFFYSAEEIKVMEADIKLAKQFGADGFVVGVLTREGNVDKDLMKKFMELAEPLPVTFHRAFDLSADPIQDLQVLLDLGCSRLLTSGQQQTAEEGLPLITKLIEEVGKSGKEMIVMPGSGINEGNLSVILQRSKTTEFHASARSLVKSSMRFQRQFVAMGSSANDLYQWQICDENKVRRMVEIAKGVWQHKS